MLSKIRDFVEGNALYFADQLRSNVISPHVKEQALYRAFLCAECLTLGNCKSCGCKTPNMFFSPNKTDSENRWSEMMTAEKWEEFKKANDISFPTDFDKIIEDYHGKTRSDNRTGPSQEFLGIESSGEADSSV